MGFDVYDYTLGKVDWLAAGLPSVRNDDSPRVVDGMTRDVATCRPDEVVEDVRARVRGDDVLVINDQDVVLGRLRLSRVVDDGALAADVMHPGPTTVRAHDDLAKTLDRLRRKNVASLVVTTPDGVLLGVVYAAEPAA